MRLCDCNLLWGYRLRDDEKEVKEKGKSLVVELRNIVVLY